MKMNEGGGVPLIQRESAGRHGLRRSWAVFISEEIQ